MKSHTQAARLAVLGVLSFVTAFALTSTSLASTGNIVKADLTGTWQIALRGTTGCGPSAMLANVTLNSAGVGTGTLVTHGQCGDSSLPGQTFTIKTLNNTGSGTAGLTCGTGCGWTLKIQVSPDRSKINLVDVAPINPGNYVEGEAILASPSGNISTSDLTGSWQMTFFGQTGCGIGAGLVTFSLDSTGASNNVTEVGHNAGCPDGSSTGNSFTILSLNPDGSGTAGLSCGVGCGWVLSIQVSPDRSSFNFVDVSSTNPGNFVGGYAINNSTAGRVSLTNLAGRWQMTLYGNTGCGLSSSVVTFTLNALGVATNATNTSHTAGCGDPTSTLNNFTVSSLSPNGSGVAGLSCGTSCGWTFNIQVSPDRSTFNVVDVSPSNPSNFLVGTAIHE
jgi:hypothetical protein